jgi:hypothetical protein
MMKMVMQGWLSWHANAPVPSQQGSRHNRLMKVSKAGTLLHQAW